jgi:flagellin-specific chaperone FliS
MAISSVQSGGNSQVLTMYQQALQKLQEAQTQASSAPPNQKATAQQALTQAESIFNTMQSLLNQSQSQSSGQSNNSLNVMA